MDKFILYLGENDYKSTISSTSKELLQNLRKINWKTGANYCFATFDFKDLQFLRRQSRGECPPSNSECLRPEVPSSWQVVPASSKDLAGPSRC